MDKITESLLSEFSQQNNLDTLDESKRFEHFTAYIVVKSEHPETFDTHDLVVGSDTNNTGGVDAGMDAIAVIVNNTLLTDVDEVEDATAGSGPLEVEFIFVQSETSLHFDGAKIGTFGFGVLDFFSDNPKLKQNDKVAGYAEMMRAIYKKSSRFTRGNPVCKTFYATTGVWQDDATLNSRIEGVKSDLDNTGLFSIVEFIPCGRSRVQQMYQKTKNAISADFVFSARVTVKPDIPGVGQAYIGFLPWSEYKKLIIDDSGNMKGGLFFDNVRDWQGFNDVNSQIRNTLESDNRNRFVLMNNGLTIIAATVQPTGDKFYIEDYQIVNGCQTSNVLFAERAILDDNVTLPIRLISTQDENVTNAIVKANNWQTQVKEEQLFALQEYPKTLEAYFNSVSSPERLYFERRSRQYDSQPVEKTRIVTFDGLIRSFAAMFLDEPHRTTRNFKSIKAKLGSEIFAKDQRMEPYYVSALAQYKLEFLFRNGHLEIKYRPARYHMLFALRILIAGIDRPQMTAYKMEAYCNKISSALSDQITSDKYIAAAAQIIDTASQGGALNRDSIRTEPFTNAVRDAALEHPGI
ncbi:MAG: hypothetical protein BGO25_05850 [Acidobacteriales bacterium 59-55]|nr:AIPR family protein [Terriglobales bacterium]OJV44604.1 MAG: hypothetical protein BGO25_05850 [Acidobacteriales bacterium 59-55]